MQEEYNPHGNFEMDEPEKVIGAKMAQGVIQVTLSWKPRSNGYKPIETIFSNEEVK